MASLLALTAALPVAELVPGETLTTDGEESLGRLYVLESGTLAVERGGIKIATIDDPGAIVGEMAALLGTRHSATVRAETAAKVRVIDDAVAFLERQPLVALHVATLACARLNATSALLVEMRKEVADKASEQGLLSRIFNALTMPPRQTSSGNWQIHE
jgi:CRP-like cAMP-binding protein